MKTISQKASSGQDLGKKNVKGKTGFKTVQNRALNEYGSESVAKKVAGSVFQKMKKKGQLSK